MERYGTPCVKYAQAIVYSPSAMRIRSPCRLTIC